MKPGRKQWRGMLVLFHRTLTQQDSAAQHDTRCTHCAKLHVLHVFLGFPFVVIFSLPLARFLSQSLSCFNTTQFLLSLGHELRFVTIPCLRLGSRTMQRVSAQALECVCAYRYARTETEPSDFQCSRVAPDDAFGASFSAASD